ncbi:MAG: hypothetical protein ACP5NF_03300 [Thermoanaerobaculum sp.]
MATGLTLAATVIWADPLEIRSHPGLEVEHPGQEANAGRHIFFHQWAESSAEDASGVRETLSIERVGVATFLVRYEVGSQVLEVLASPEGLRSGDFDLLVCPGAGGESWVFVFGLGRMSLPRGLRSMAPAAEGPFAWRGTPADG